MDDFEIFKAGRHTSVNGQTIDFSDADIAASAAAYDPALHEAPIVVGHPKMDLPAYGWIGTVATGGGGSKLVATPTQVDPAFAEIVKAGRYKKVSASFYPPTSANNPMPGVWYLKHVGFLGAVPPSVKGLRAISFADGDDAVEFADWTDLTVVSLFRRFRDWLIAEKGQDVADQVMPSDALDALALDAAQPDPTPDDQTAYGEPSMAERQQQTALTAEELAAREATLALRETAFAEQQRLTRRKDVESFVDGLVRDTKLVSGERAGMVAFMEAIAGGNDAVEFAEAGGKTVKTDPVAWFKGFAGKLKPLVQKGELAGAETADFADDTTRITVASRKYIAEQKAIGREVGPAEAVSFVTRSGR